MYNSANMTQIKTMYNEYRVKKITIHVMVYYASCSAGTIGQLINTTAVVAVNPTIISVAWQRQSAYLGSPTPLSTAAMAILP